MIDRKHIGTVFPERTVDVEKGQIAFLAKTIGEQDPIYFDELAARAKGHPRIPAPPTFGWTLRLLGAPINTDLKKLGVNLAEVLHGEESFIYHEPIYAGDRIRLSTTVTDIYQKKRGALEFVVQETTARNQHERLALTMRTVLIVRHG